MAQFATLAAINGNGTVFAVNAQGVSRALKVGDELQKGETIRTVGDVRVELMMEDGRLLAVAPAQTVRLDDNVLQSEQRPTAQDSALSTPATADTIIQALERGTDLNQTLEATASGPGTGGGTDGGSSFVQLLRIVEGVDPLTYNYSYSASGSTGTTQQALLTTDTTLHLTADAAVTEGSAGITYTATLGGKALTDMSITLSNGAVITIAAGQASGSVLVPVHAEDVYLNAAPVTASVSSVTGGGFSDIVVNDSNVITAVNDTVTPVTVDLSASIGVLESGAAAYTFTATLSAASQGVTTIVTDKGTITIGNGETTGTLLVAGANGEDVYKDASSLKASITSASGGNFEHLVIGNNSATATIVDTTTPVTVNLSASAASEGAGAGYTFTATLSAASQGVTTIVTDKGTITIGNGETTGTLLVAGANGEDVYKDAGSLQATITSASGGNFENLVIGNNSATATIADTATPVTVNLSASAASEGADAGYTFTATLVGGASQGVTTIVTDKGTITIGNGETTGTLLVAGANGEDVYKDASSLQATITSASGGNFEQINVGTASATASIVDTLTPVTVGIVSSDAGAVQGVAHFNVTVSEALDRDLSVTLSNGETITIATGNTSASYTHAVPVGTSEAHSYTLGVADATVVGATFEQLHLGHAVSVDVFVPPPPPVILSAVVAPNILSDGNESNSVAENTTLTVSNAATTDTANLLHNTINPDGPSGEHISTFTWGSNSDMAAGTLATQAGVGTLQINGDGSYTFTPVHGYIGEVPSATYSVTDGVTTVNSTLALTITGNIPSGDGEDDNGDGGDSGGSGENNNSGGNSGGSGENNNGGGENNNSGGENTNSGGENTNSGGENTNSGGENTNSGGENINSGGENTNSGGENNNSGGENNNSGGENNNSGGENNNGGGNSGSGGESNSGNSGSGGDSNSGNSGNGSEGSNNSGDSGNSGSSHDNNGWGNGDQDAPGNSLGNNNAENSQDLKGNQENSNDMSGGHKDDHLVGGSHNDHLQGGGGDDVETGGLGADTFVWKLADLGSAGHAAHDVVSDFSAGDKLDIKDILTGDSHHDLSSEIVGSDTHIHIADKNGHEVQEITLQGYHDAEGVARLMASLKSSGEGTA